MGYRFKEKQPPQEQGPLWDISGRYTDYEGARLLKEALLLNSGHLDVKIHVVSEKFVVKTREKKVEDLPEITKTKKKYRKNKKGKKNRRHDES